LMAAVGGGHSVHQWWHRDDPVGAFCPPVVLTLCVTFTDTIRKKKNRLLNDSQRKDVRATRLVAPVRTHCGVRPTVWETPRCATQTMKTARP
jgi:hypothetical protein